MNRITQTRFLTWLAVVALPGTCLSADDAKPVSKTIVGADRDSHFRWVPPDFGNEGTNTVLSIGENDYGQLRRAVVSFDLSGIPAGAQVSRAVLLMRQTGAGGVATNAPGVNISVHRLLQDWEHHAVSSTKRTASAQWSKAGAEAVGVDRAEKATAVANNVRDRNLKLKHFIEWDVTADAQAFVAGAEKNFGWLLIADTEPVGGPVGSVNLNATERGAEYAPRLDVSYVASPSSQSKNNNTTISIAAIRSETGRPAVLRGADLAAVVRGGTQP